MSHFSSLATLLVVVFILVVIRSEPIKEGRCVLREQRAAPLPPMGELLHQTLAGLEIAIHLHKVFRARREHLACLSVVVLALFEGGEGRLLVGLVVLARVPAAACSLRGLLRLL